MRPLRYSINVTLDGCCDHRAGTSDEETHWHATESIAGADALLFGRVTYQMMETAFREPGRTGVPPQWMVPWMMPFARTIHAAKKYVVSGTLAQVDWNAELLRGDLGPAVQKLKQEPGRGLFVGGVKLPLALAELGLIDVRVHRAAPPGGARPDAVRWAVEVCRPEAGGTVRVQIRRGGAAIRIQEVTHWPQKSTKKRRP